ncbi:Testican-2 [Labeo rohita]|uniref:Testican-2 n=1 Tax=Labeo rohita TaxID=84645 RepID=A0ABQ8M5P9_LABRO|nr:Testican-2 [Labeo rohita]
MTIKAKRRAVLFHVSKFTSHFLSLSSYLLSAGLTLLKEVEDDYIRTLEGPQASDETLQHFTPLSPWLSLRLLSQIDEARKCATNHSAGIAARSCFYGNTSSAAPRRRGRDVMACAVLRAGSDPASLRSRHLRRLFNMHRVCLDTTKDPCQKVKCSRHKVCVAQGYQRAMCVNRRKLQHRIRQSGPKPSANSCKPCSATPSTPVCGSDGHNYASQGDHRKQRLLIEIEERERERESRAARLIHHPPAAVHTHATRSRPHATVHTAPLHNHRFLRKEHRKGGKGGFVKCKLEQQACLSGKDLSVLCSGSCPCIGAGLPKAEPKIKTNPETSPEPKPGRHTRINRISSRQVCTGQDLADLGDRLRDWFQLLHGNAKQNNSGRQSTASVFDRGLVAGCKDSIGWMFSKLDTSNDLFLDQSELAAINLEKYEVCIRPFFNSCDSYRDGKVSTAEWCLCFWREKPPCLAEIERIQIQEASKRKPGMYIPSCDEDGYYRKQQCDHIRGECWCVDPHGAEATGSRIHGNPDCDELLSSGDFSSGVGWEDEEEKDADENAEEEEEEAEPGESDDGGYIWRSRIRRVQTSSDDQQTPTASDDRHYMNIIYTNTVQ